MSSQNEISSIRVVETLISQIEHNAPFFLMRNISAFVKCCGGIYWILILYRVCAPEVTR
uniref:Uncharacterized protein n=1 Tax=Arundo donax TaxID=35708 RepID=A0A0A9BIH7_ARUDO